MYPCSRMGLPEKHSSSPSCHFTHSTSWRGRGCERLRGVNAIDLELCCKKKQTNIVTLLLLFLLPSPSSPLPRTPTSALRRGIVAMPSTLTKDRPTRRKHDPSLFLSPQSWCLRQRWSSLGVPTLADRSAVACGDNEIVLLQLLYKMPETKRYVCIYTCISRAYMCAYMYM